MDQKLRKMIEAGIEFDAAPDGTRFEAPHPVFQLVSDVDLLRQRVEILSGFALTLIDHFPPENRPPEVEAALDKFLEEVDALEREERDNIRAMQEMVKKMGMARPFLRKVVQVAMDNIQPPEEVKGRIFSEMFWLGVNSLRDKLVGSPEKVPEKEVVR